MGEAVRQHHTGPRLHASLFKLALTQVPTPRKPSMATDSKGRPCKVDDTTILAMRRMHEIERKTHTQVHSAYPQHSIKYIRDVLGYIVRAHLQVK